MAPATDAADGTLPATLEGVKTVRSTTHCAGPTSLIASSPRQPERNDFRGAPSDPTSAEELDARFLSLTDSIGDRAPALLGELCRLDEIAAVRALF